MSAISLHRPKKVLLALDGTSQDLFGVEIAKSFSQRFDCEITVVDARTSDDPDDLAIEVAPTLNGQAVPKTSTLALTNATLPYAVEIANKGWKKAMKQNPEIKLGANVVKGKVTYRGVADAFGLKYTPIDSLIKK